MEFFENLPNYGNILLWACILIIFFSALIVSILVICLKIGTRKQAKKAAERIELAKIMPENEINEFIKKRDKNKNY